MGAKQGVSVHYHSMESMQLLKPYESWNTLIEQSDSLNYSYILLTRILLLDTHLAWLHLGWRRELGQRVWMHQACRVDLSLVVSTSANTEKWFVVVFFRVVFIYIYQLGTGGHTQKAGCLSIYNLHSSLWRLQSNSADDVADDSALSSLSPLRIIYS